MATTPAQWLDQLGRVRLVGELVTTDAVGLPTGWTEDASDPANVNGHAGSLKFDDGTNDTVVEAGGVQVESGTTDEFYRIEVGEGIKSTAPTGVPCFAAFDDESATVALDAGGLDIENVGAVTTVNLTSTGNTAIGNAGSDTLGFYGATPVTQAAAPVTLGDVIAALKALGLVAT